MLNVGIIGLGRMGNAHAKFFMENPDTQITAFYDPETKAAQAGEALLGLPVSDSFTELILNPKVDAIVITSPTYCHTVSLLAAMQTGKPIFCEKPLCRSWAEAMAIQTAASCSKSLVQIGFVRRFSPIQQVLVKLAQDGTLGRLRFCNIDLVVGGFKRMPGDWFANFNLCGGVVLDMLSHHLDLLDWCFGEPARLYAQGLLEDPALPEPADYASGTITFKNGVICNIITSWYRFGRDANYMEIYGDDACASFKWGGKCITLTRKGEKPEEITAPDIDNPYYEGFRSWLKAIAENRQPDVTLQDGINALRLALGMLKSASTGDVINF